MFDHTHPVTVIEAKSYVENIRMLLGWIPLLIAGNKVESLDKQVSAD